MEYVLLGIGSIAGIVAFVCAVLVAVKMLQNNQTPLGVITIIGLFVCGIGYLLALIFGWQNRNVWGLQKVMPIFTISFILSLVLAGSGYAILITKAINEVNRQNAEINSEEYGSTDFDLNFNEGDSSSDFDQN